MPSPLSPRLRRASSFRQEKPRSLPDLTNVLKEQGVYEDYLKWQRGYQRWRQGGAKGARGELGNQEPTLGCLVEAPTTPGEVPDQGDLVVEDV